MIKGRNGIEAETLKLPYEVCLFEIENFYIVLHVHVHVCTFNKGMIQ